MTMEGLLHELEVLLPEAEITHGLPLQSATNRALRNLYYDRIIEKKIRLANRGIRPTYYKKELLCEAGKEYTLPLKGKAYSMRVHGQGRYSIEDGPNMTVRAIDSLDETIVIRGFLSQGGCITFWGSFSFIIYDFSVFNEIVSEYTEDIPDGGPIRTFDLRQLYGDYMCFTSSPTDSKGNLISTCRLYDGRVEIDADYEGEIFLSYRRLPNHVGDGITEELDVPPEYLHLFPILVAHYLLLASDPTLSKLFKDRYDDIIAHISANSYDRLNAYYPDTHGWA